MAEHDKAVEALLLEGLSSGDPIEMQPNDWRRLRLMVQDLRTSSSEED